jgi:hypothetical protein
MVYNSMPVVPGYDVGQTHPLNGWGDLSNSQINNLWQQGYGGAGMGGYGNAGMGGMFGNGSGGFGSMLSGIGGLLGGLFGGGNYKNPADAAVPYLNQIRGSMAQYYDPYINAGQQAMGTLMPQYQNLINNPTGVMNAIGKTYQASPGYQYNVDQATKASNQAAAAGGMVGSPAQQQSLAQNISGMANQDYNQYLQTALGQYGQGLQGMGGINQLGYGASSNMADNLAQALMTQAQLSYAGQNNANQQGGGGGGGFGSLLGAGASLLGSLF